MTLFEPCPKCGYLEPAADDFDQQTCQRCNETVDIDVGYVLKDEIDSTLYVICPNCESTIATLSPTLTSRECTRCGEVFADFNYAFSQGWMDED